MGVRLDTGRTEGAGLPTANRACAAPRSPTYDLPVAVRLAESTDLPFVYACWVRAVQASRNLAYRELPTNTLRAVERFLRLADTNWVSAAQHALAERLLKRSVVLIACNPKSPTQIYGYMVVEPTGPVAHFLFVKRKFRRLGVARRLMEAGCPGALETGEAVQVTYRPPHELASWPLTYRSTNLCEGSDR